MILLAICTANDQTFGVSTCEVVGSLEISRYDDRTSMQISMSPMNKDRTSRAMYKRLAYKVMGRNPHEEVRMISPRYFHKNEISRRFPM